MKTAVMDFTGEQLALIEEPGSAYVEACPGAGKTQSIVERFVQRPHVDKHRGVALMSFTNAAIDEARSRCSNDQALLAAPNFVGTIDSFIHRFIVRPVYVSRERKLLTVKDSWASVQASTFALRSLPDTPFDLSWFDLDLEGHATFVAKRVPYRDREPYQELSQSVIGSANRAATSRFQKFISNGVVDCSFARKLLSSYLNDSDLRATIIALIGERFSEIIVDEVQDCSSSDIELLSLLTETTAHVVLVGDPDQAIYGFRGSDTAATRKLTESIPAGRRISGNFRSSPAVCSLVSSLRSGKSVDEPVGENKGNSAPIVLLPFDILGNFAKDLRRVAEEYGVDPAKMVCLAHNGENARKCAGARPQSRRSRSRLGRIAAACATLRDTSSSGSQDRVNAQRDLEVVLRELASNESSQFDQDGTFYQKVGASAREVRSQLARLAFSADPYVMTPIDYKELVIKFFQKRQWEWIDSSRLRTPTAWPQPSEVNSGSLNWSTVHGYKGLGTDGVALVIPAPLWAGQRDAVYHWREGKSDESRRVLYVGASRARKLLVLVLDDSQLDIIESVLEEEDSVPYAIVKK